MSKQLGEDQRDRAAAALVAGAIGDALGWPNESNNRRIPKRPPTSLQTGRFEAWKRRAGGRFFAHEEQIGAGEYSDDTQLVIATARALVRGGADWPSVFVQQELPAWLLYERGGGRTLKAAARSWAKGTAPWVGVAAQTRYLNAGGNGVAMRVFPHAAWNDGELRALRAGVLLNGVATHGHPRALAGGLLFAAAGVAALRHSGPWRLGELLDATADLEEIWHDPPTPADQTGAWALPEPLSSAEYHKAWLSTATEIRLGLDSARRAVDKGTFAIDGDVLRELGAFDKSSLGSGVTAAIVAMFLAARYAADPATGVRAAAYASGSDTDTIAGMTGALLGAMLGSAWIPPEWQTVQDREYLARLGTTLCMSHGPDRSRSTVHTSWTEEDSREIHHKLGYSPASLAKLGPLGDVRVVSGNELRPLTKSGHAMQWRLMSSEGQTVFVTRLSRSVDRAELPPGDEQLALASIQEQDGPSHRAGVSADLEGLSRALGEKVRAKELLALLEDVVCALVSRFGSKSPAGAVSWSDVVSSLRFELRRAHLSEEGLHRIARIAWRLVYGSDAGRRRRRE